MRAIATLTAAWREPADVLASFAEAPFALGLISGGGGSQGRWSYVARDPDAVRILTSADRDEPFAALGALIGDPPSPTFDGPPFQGGVVALCAYEMAERVEPVGLARLEAWPDLACARYPSILAFDHEARSVLAIGRGADLDEARRRAGLALGWLAPGPMPPVASPGLDEAALVSQLQDEPGWAYRAAAAEVIARIGQGEMFQANIARRWRGRLATEARPFDLFRRLLTQSPAPFAAYLRLPDRAIVSNSPERFVRVRPDAGRLLVETRPIKGTIRRDPDPAKDLALATALAASAKDRAENLMIVDLMRNDLSRVCAVGSVTAPQLCAVESFANVHHLVSVVRGVLAPGRSAIDLLRAAFPPGSITGAPKRQAMTVIAALEPPRGPFFGALVWAGFDGAMDSSVLIRTVACVQDQDGWRFEARAGGGVVADSDPQTELAETEAKFAALRRALTGGGPIQA